MASPHAPRRPIHLLGYGLAVLLATGWLILAVTQLVPWPTTPLATGLDSLRLGSVGLALLAYTAGRWQHAPRGNWHYRLAWIGGGIFMGTTILAGILR